MSFKSVMAGEVIATATTVAGEVIATVTTVAGAMGATGAAPTGVMIAVTGGGGAPSVGRNAVSGVIAIAACRSGSTAADDNGPDHPGRYSLSDGFVDARLDPVAIAGLSSAGGRHHRNAEHGGDHEGDDGDHYAHKRSILVRFRD
ncbi:hypothetical protein ACVIRO_002310 [Rhizobium ruizarguesonis]